MPEQNPHLSDEKLLLYADGEASGKESAAVREHLSACRSCRLRMRELDDAVADATRLHRETSDRPLPAPEGPRALLKARLRELASAVPDTAAPPGIHRYARVFTMCAATAVLLAIVWIGAQPNEAVAIPRYDLTPGAVRAVAVTDVCRDKLAGNADVMPAVERLVFAEYGMTNAERRAYEVDYLITPALGGSDDIRNLWPQPYRGSPWNAYVKDALEDHLRGMVCSGQLDLRTAQTEIAANWIGAYKKYFHTRRPLPQHSRRDDRTE
jgi:hypothetical protein